MKNSNTNEDFVDYANSHWIKRQDIKDTLKLLREYIYSSMANNKTFTLTWIAKFQVRITTTTFVPWKKFKKVKIIASDLLNNSVKIKW